MAEPVAPETRSPLGALHDLELTALAAGGDRRAFGELARRHGSAVRALLRRMGATPSLADDLAQDAFLAAFEAIAEFRGEGAFVGWVKRIAARLYVKRWRKRAELEPLETEESAGAEDGEGDAALRLDLDDALATLTEAERVCVSLCYGAGLSHAEAAAALKTPLGTVKSHVKRGLDKLRRRLATPGEAPQTDLGRRAGV
jgi:RNA polymerase sigma-70 factor (ECF subfamily)